MRMAASHRTSSERSTDMAFNWFAYDNHEAMDDETLEQAVAEATASATEYLDTRCVPAAEQLDLSGELIPSPVQLDDE